MWRPGWICKAMTQQVLSVVPGGARANYVLQRHITHSYPVTDASLEADIVKGSADDIAAIEALPPHDRFQEHSAHELAIRESRMVLAKRRDR